MPQVLYAGTNSGKTFPQTAESESSRSAFRLTLRSGREATFVPIGIGNIGTNNHLDEVAEVSYDGLKMTEARDFTVEAEGECVKTDGGWWKVTRKVKIRLTRQ